ncbi:hypothetical protein CAOG_009775 [Capsaspora owczarzaki ATCC 30864]|uniref:Uncharacterized protein n=1 Tax=Capsaspora owczarzaki (strain ATCC 30864) TaxID=595528 RepID=A0A0D2WQ82_CAPO3|nr:hypothetical protein CAOG_009775 [Capsaspora owczarzaki ATCC 30864]
MIGIVVAPPTLPEPAFDAFLSPAGAVLVPSFGAIQFPTFGGVRSRIERNCERPNLLIWPRRSRSTSASGPPSGTEAKAPAATVNPSAEDDRALIDRLPEALRKSFEAKWEAPALRKHLLEKLSTAQLFLSQKNAISVVQTELSAFASVVPEAISDTEQRRRTGGPELYPKLPNRLIAETVLDWIRLWSKNQAFMTVEELEGKLAQFSAREPSPAQEMANKAVSLDCDDEAWAAVGNQTP